MLRDRILEIGVSLVVVVGIACGGRTSMNGLDERSDEGGEASSDDEDNDVVVRASGGQSQSGGTVATNPGPANQAPGRSAAGGYSVATTKSPSGSRNAGGAVNTGGTGHLTTRADGGGAGHVHAGGDPQTAGSRTAGVAGRSSMAGRRNVPGVGGWSNAAGTAGPSIRPLYPVAAPGNSLIDVLPGLSLTKSCLVCAQDRCPEARACSNVATCADAVSCIAGPLLSHG